jgi:predicted dehydrogenase
MEETKSDLLEKYAAKNLYPSIVLHEHHEDLVNDPNVDLVMIVTPQYAHRDPAISALRSGKKVFLDKPMAAKLEDALKILEEETETNNKLNMGFTRRYESTWLKIYDLVGEGIIGDIKMILVRDIIPYHIYFHTWHRKREWSGGVIGDKASHFFDVFNWFAGCAPKKISAFGGQAVFQSDPESPERCIKCDRECPYRIGQKQEEKRQDVMVDFGESRAKEIDVIKRFDNCVYLSGADINDHGIVSVVYPNGIKASLFWSIFGPDADDQETFEVVGDKGRIILTRHTGKIDIISDFGKNHEILDEREKSFAGSHFGADRRLIVELEKFYKGKASIVTGKDGFEAVRMAEAAHRSINSGGRLVYMKDVS